MHSHDERLLSRRRWLAAATLLLSGAACHRRAAPSEGSVRVAVASNFSPTLSIILARFEKERGNKVEVSSGSTGKLYAQIEHGAPLDVFLSADAERPARLEREGLAVPSSRFVYAVGRLALYGSALKHPEDGMADLRAGDFRRLAIANPETAPYGAAARQVLERLGLWSSLLPRIARGENISQALQYVESGAAELGILAWSSVIDKPRSSYFLVPERLHAVIAQEGVLLARAENDQRARSFLDFMKSAEVRSIIAATGYDVPRVSRGMVSR